MTARAILALALCATGCAGQWHSIYRTPESAPEAHSPRPGEVYAMRGWIGEAGPRYTVLDVRDGRVRYALREDSWPPGLSETGTVTVDVFRSSTISLATDRLL